MNEAAQSRRILTLDDRRLELIVGVLIWIGVFILYATTAGPGIVELFDDSLEFQLVGPTLGIAHPTGYPLYTLLGGLWSRVVFPFGSWAWRMNLLSALAGASAVTLVYFSANQMIPDEESTPLWAGLAAAGAFAFGPVWWSQATIAEVYTLHGLLMAAILLTALTVPKLCASGCEPNRGTAAFRRILLLSLLVGLSLTHHRMSVLLLPGLFVYSLLLIPQMWRPRREWLFWLAGLFLPMLLYLYIPLRAAMGVRDLNGSYVNTISGFFNHILARQYTAFFNANDVGQVVAWQALFNTHWKQMGVIALVLAAIALIGMPLLGKVARANWALIVVSLLASLFFVRFYQVADWEVFLIPSFMLAALFTGAGVAMFKSRLRRIPYASAAVSAMLTVLVLFGVWGRGAAVDRSDNWAAHQYAYLLADSGYPSGSRVIGIEGEMTAIRYMQASEGLAAAVTTQTADDPAVRAKAVSSSIAQGTPTFITRELSEISTQYTFSSLGEAVQVWPRGQAQVQPVANTLKMDVIPDALRLHGYELVVRDVPGGQVIEVTLGWLPTKRIDEVVKVSLRLIHDDGSPVLDADGIPVVVDEFPVRQAALSTDWAQDQLIRDTHTMTMPSADDPLSLLVILYDAETAQELARFEAPVEG